jgi:broad specificity phosphatase PhoE
MEKHKIVLIRHAESLANIDLDIHLSIPDHDISLSSHGRIQAESLDLRYLGSSHWYSSPYRRALWTLVLSKREYLMEGSLLNVEPLVAERRIADRWGTEYYKLIVSEWKKRGSFWWDGFDFGYESGAKVYERASIFLNKISHKHFSGDCPETVVVFTHGFFMQMMRICLIGDEGIDINGKRKNPDNTEQWIFSSEDGKNWELESEIKNEKVETRINNIPE